MSMNCLVDELTQFRPCMLSRYFSLDLCHFKFCDRVFTQSTDFYDDIPVSLVPDKYGLENGVFTL